MITLYLSKIVTNHFLYTDKMSLILSYSFIYCLDIDIGNAFGEQNITISALRISKITEWKWVMQNGEDYISNISIKFGSNWASGLWGNKNLKSLETTDDDGCHGKLKTKRLLKLYKGLLLHLKISNAQKMSKKKDIRENNSYLDMF
jgi:hypothetical protein